MKIFGLFMVSLVCDGGNLTLLQACDALVTWQSGPYLFASSFWCFSNHLAMKIFNDSSTPWVEGLVN